MCGIAGVIATRGELSSADVATAERMTAMLVHRGPDSRGRHVTPKVALGNTRLAILDPSHAADLPMTSADGAVHLAYNGEVTNFRDLRARHRLDQRFALRTTSDSEVVLCLYQDLGLASLTELTGQFAFCLHDERRRKVHLVRDFYGNRPLFFMRRPDRLYFASELKAFFEVPGFDPTPDPEAIWHFMSLAYIPGRLTPYRSVEELRPSHRLEIDLDSGRVAEHRYYEIRFDPDPTITEDDIAEPLHQAMLDSVRRNLIADAPLGLTLSGGFDTSSILTLAGEVTDTSKLHTFSIVMDEASFNEKRYQDVMVDFAKTIHHEVVVRPQDVVGALIEHMAYLDEPTGDGAAVPFYLLAKEATKHVKVLVSGEGGDETFNAYETHAALRARALYRRWVPDPLRRLAAAVAAEMPCRYEKLSLDFVAKRFTAGALLPVPEAHLYWRHVLTEADKRELMPGYRPRRPTAAFFTEIYDAYDDPDDLDRISRIDIEHYYVDDLMVKNDRTVMAHSIEARFPYMDRLLHEFVAKIPASLRMKGFQRRHIQKRALKGRIPAAIYDRQNMGLEMPHSLWFLGGMRGLAEQWLTRERVGATGLFDPDVVQRLWDDHLARRHDNGRTLWCILNVLLWHDLFVARQGFRDHLRARP